MIKQRLGNGRSGWDGGHQYFKEQNTWPVYFQVQR